MVIPGCGLYGTCAGQSSWGLRQPASSLRRVHVRYTIVHRSYCCRLHCAATVKRRRNGLASSAAYRTLERPVTQRYANQSLIEGGPPHVQRLQRIREWPWPWRRRRGAGAVFRQVLALPSEPPPQRHRHVASLQSFLSLELLERAPPFSSPAMFFFLLHTCPHRSCNILGPFA